MLAALVPAVAEPPELFRLKCAGHHHKGNTHSNALQTEQFLVCRVTSRYNHWFSDRTSIPRTMASPEIFNHKFYNTGITVITISLKHYYRSKLSKSLLLTFTNAPDLYTASAWFVVAFPLEYSHKIYQSVVRQCTY